MHGDTCQITEIPVYSKLNMYLPMYVYIYIYIYITKLGAVPQINLRFGSLVQTL